MKHGKATQYTLVAFNESTANTFAIWKMINTGVDL